MKEELPQQDASGKPDRVTEQVQEEEPQTLIEAVTQAADEDPALSMDSEKKIKDKITGKH